ncbi:MAG: 2-oxo acid dehydrogenase subunit E2 [Phycisphaerae bacterium]|nr:2-oxo acid dehydrogenase subunit E2 [Phycisphaerae bacterium]
MPIEITMPRLSDTMQQGTVVKWNVREGQEVSSGDVIADIETDKATMELQSFDDGTVASLAVPEGKTVAVGTVIAVLAAKGEDASAASAAKTAPAVKAEGETAAPSATAVAEPKAAPRREESATSNGGRVFASPLARKIAEESGVDLGRVQGSGPGGRIIRRDVEQAVGQAPAAGAAPAAAAPSVPPLGAALKGKTVPLSNMRRVIARRLVESKQAVPHYQVTVEVDMDPLLSLRKQLNEQLASQGVKLSVNDFLVRACALAMHSHPYVNSRWVPTANNEAIELLAEVNVAIAIALPEEKGGGLVVATIRRADQIGLRQISAESKRLADKARAKGLSPEEMGDSTFTISNLGMFGVAHFTAIINPPNVAILAVGGAIERPVVKNGQVVPGHVMAMTMSSDHRVVDGAMAAQYLATVRQLLESPATLLV